MSPDGRMLAFKRSSDAFLSDGQIHVKLLPSGESVQITSDSDRKYGPVFTPDGSRIVYTRVTAGSWDTWTVPVLGGEAKRLLPNASGLTWLTDRRILFSEIKTGVHMGLVTATESRAESREIYFPRNEHGMVHFSYASPDRQSVLVVEMDQAHAFHQPCRLLPFDGRSPGRDVGPQGSCTAAAWSPDGQWMYFGVVVNGSSHLWRQRFADGAPEQITFGPTEEEGIALAPDGRSLVTSVGTRRSAIWIHSAPGERAIVSEGYAAAPRFSRDGTRVFYLDVRDFVLKGAGWVASSSELRSLNLASGKSDSVLPGVSVEAYDLSRDETEVVYTTKQRDGTSQMWLASLDRRTAPRLIGLGGDQVSFGADGGLIFRSLLENNAIVWIKKDGSDRRTIESPSVIEKMDVSPDGEWVITLSERPGQNRPYNTIAVPIRGGAVRNICVGNCVPRWSFDGKFFHVSGLVIPVPAGRSLPDLPAAGIDEAGGATGLPGVRTIEHRLISPGPDSATYLFTKTELQRNLFRIPLH